MINNDESIHHEVADIIAKLKSAGIHIAKIANGASIDQECKGKLCNAIADLSLQITSLRISIEEETVDVDVTRSMMRSAKQSLTQVKTLI